VGTGREEGRAPGGVTARDPLGLRGAGGPGHGGDRPGGGAGGSVIKHKNADIYGLG